MPKRIAIAIDGPAASGKSTLAQALAEKLDYIYFDTGAMYRTLAWHCLQNQVDVGDAKAVGMACRKWKATLECVDGHVHLLVNGYYPAKEIRTGETSAAVPHVAAVPKVREWMKATQRDCVRFGNLVMEGRDIVKAGTLAEFSAAAERPSFMHAEHGAVLDVTMYPAWKYDGYKWGMSVNQAACIGCTKCIQACPVDAIIGDTHGKFAARDAKIPLFRFGFPNFDRVNLHREPLVGYQGVLNMMSTICNKFIDIVDETCDDRHFEMMR